MSSHDGGRSVRQSKRYSMTTLYLSMSANEKDLEIEDDLAKAQKILRDLKSKISSQSKKNFVLEKDVRYLDSRIALLIQNRMALEEQNEVASHLEDASDLQEGFFPNDEKTQKYGNLLFLLQSEPRHIAHLCRLVTMAEIDSLLQTVMFTIYGNQYESREEHLLLTMFQSVLTYQFDNTPEYSSLLRANTPVSRMMTTYTRRGPGQSYLKTVLADRINGLIELKDLDLEINPLKVYERMIEQIEADTGSLPASLPRGVTAEQAADNTQVQAIIEPRLTMLMEIANGFLSTIIEGLEETPYGIRWICKQIRSLTKRKYPDANDQVICTLIGGFFFLRFINPAIVTPKSYMLIDGTPAERPRRTLTLIAKMLQNLANKPSYAKEPYMAKLQPFIQQNKERVNKFMLDLCEVQDFYESLEMDNYVALSKKDLELSITLNEVYATHALLEKHSNELNKDDNSHLAVILADLGTAPPQLPRKENRAINLPLFSKWETAIDDLTAALDITQEEVFFMEAKSTFVQIMRSIPSNSAVARRPLRLERVADAAATSRNDAVMVRKGIRAMELLSQLQELGVIDKSDQFSTLRDEVEQELQHLGSLKDGVIVETQKLDEVFKTIRDHNSYLVGQLETYKSYLHNVRSQSEGTRRKQQKHQVLGPYKFTHQQLEKEGVIQKSNVPDNRRANIYFNFTSPLPGTFVISLHYKGRNRGLLELDLKLDDLLEMQKDNQEDLDLEYVQFNVPKVLALLNKRFARKKGWGWGTPPSPRQPTPVNIEPRNFDVNLSICDSDDDDLSASIMARLARGDSGDELPEVTAIVPSSRNTGRRDAKKRAGTVSNSRKVAGGVGEENGIENEATGRGKEKPQNKVDENESQKAKPRKRILKQKTDNPLLRPLTATTASSSEQSIRKTSVKTFLVAEKEIVAGPKKIQITQPEKAKIKSRRKIEESESESDGMSDFVVSDDESVFLIESSEEEVEEVAKTLPRSVRRLVRGRRPVREQTPEDLGGGEESEDDDLVGRIKKLSMGEPEKQRRNEMSSRERPEDLETRTKKEPVMKKKVEDLGLDLDDQFSHRFLPQPIIPRKEPLPKKKSQPPSSDLEDPFTLRFSPSQTKPKKPSKKAQFTTPPSSPDLKPSKFLSPTKNPPRIPDSPHKPDSNEFWDIDVINDWNNEYSPQKPILPTRPLSDTPGKLLFSPGKKSPSKPDRAAKAAKKAFADTKNALAESFLQELDTQITAGQIATLSASTGGVKIIWSNKLNTTAGRATWKRETLKSATGVTHRHHAAIELASKVIDDEERLLNVVAHEFCHLANFMVSGIKDRPHGKEFKEWAAKVSRVFGARGVEVTTKHGYEIAYKFRWECGDCGLGFERHSRSIDTKRHRCGGCKGVLVQVRPVPREGVGEGKGKGGTQYNEFVREHLGRVREENPGSPLKVIMGLVGERWREMKRGEVGGNEGRDRGVKGKEPGKDEVEDVVRKLDFLDLTSP
ncbi:GTPase activation, GAP [Glarea lozoyensis ATCC 20868]|uniref:GTPase activation, GAP n=2 Tax=Glarea lozoyensis TaxID=101852 RepID=S3CHN9_GLAL2|nr:GTPase activation, GAP [Glarea lozoyensis ATCC 20868]EPE25992.1 GTPase activation, GAP [Glarea lozoyensis ATCC 20868]